MVKFTLPLLALATSASAAAVIAEPTKTTTSFSFEQWVEDIIANPDTALTVDEAIAAAQAADVVGPSTGGLGKRDPDWYSCNQPNWKRANGRDGAACADDLARKGFNGQNCVIASNQDYVEMCGIGNALVAAARRTQAVGNPNPLSVNCNDVARTVGRIFDKCWRADDTVVGASDTFNSDLMSIWLSGR